MDPLAIASLGIGVAKSFAGLFDNSAAQQKHAQDKARVAAIDAQNQKTHFNNLSIRARVLNKRARLSGQFSNIRDAQMRLSAERQLKLDRLVDESLMRNESDSIRMFRSLTGSESGRMNLDSSTLAELGRANAYRRNKLMRSEDDMITSGYLDRFAAQNMRGRLTASAGQQPIYQPYIENYTPTVLPQQNKLLDFALGLGGSTLNALSLNKQLQPPEIGEVKDIDFGAMAQSANSALSAPTALPVIPFKVPGASGGLTEVY
tara:strand:- start:832 stop:1614 length:783 start_codon:yes stop_codon:yes gene_type:complete